MFTIAYLGDNDFGLNLKDGLEEYFSGFNYDGDTEEDVKTFLIVYVLGYLLKREIPRSWHGHSANKIELDKHTQDYLVRKLRIVRQKHPPTEDHDSGSACYDPYRGQAFTF